MAEAIEDGARNIFIVPWKLLIFTGAECYVITIEKARFDLINCNGHNSAMNRSRKQLVWDLTSRTNIQWILFELFQYDLENGSNSNAIEYFQRIIDKTQLTQEIQLLLIFWQKIIKYMSICSIYISLVNIGYFKTHRNYYDNEFS